jgi:hypothetical protein
VGLLSNSRSQPLLAPLETGAIPADNLRPIQRGFPRRIQRISHGNKLVTRVAVSAQCEYNVAGITEWPFIP